MCVKEVAAPGTCRVAAGRILTPEVAEKREDVSGRHRSAPGQKQEYGEQKWEWEWE